MQLVDMDVDVDEGYFVGGWGIWVNRHLRLMQITVKQQWSGIR